MSEIASEKLCSASAISASEPETMPAHDLRDRQTHVDRDGGEYPAVACVGIDVMMVAVPHSGNSFRFVSFQDRYDLQRL